MIFSIKFTNFIISENNFEQLRNKVIEICNDCIIHDCNTNTGFTIQLKPRDYKIKGRVEMTSNYNNENVLVIGIAKEFQSQWSMEIMEKLVKELQNFDESIR